MAEYLDKAGATLIISKTKALVDEVDAKVTALENAGYQTADDVAGIVDASVADAVSTAVTDAVSSMNVVTPEIVSELPEAESAEEGKIYFVATGATEGDIYEEYMYINGAFEPIGGAAIDLSDYLKSEDVTAITTQEILAIWEA